MTNHRTIPQLAAAAVALLLGASLPTHAAILAEDDFSHQDGNLVGRGGAGSGWAGGWTNFYGSTSSIVTTSGVVSGQPAGEEPGEAVSQYVPVILEKFRKIPLHVKCPGCGSRFIQQKPAAARSANPPPYEKPSSKC